MNIVLTGERGIGKSTVCSRLCELSKNIKGYIRLSDDLWIFPEQFNHRYFVKDSVVKIGKYCISPEIFDIVREDYFKSGIEYERIILDEFGPLELMEKGFSTLYNSILEEKSCLIPVRSSGDTLEKFLERYSSKKFKIIVIDRKNREELAERILRIWDE